MKYKYSIFIITIFILVLIGTYQYSVLKNNSSISASWEPQYTDVWIENEYTAFIHQPEYGELEYYVDNRDSERTFILYFKDMTRDKTHNYIDQLIADGYTKTAQEENEDSGTAWLDSTSVLLQFSYSGDRLLLSIVMTS